MSFRKCSLSEKKHTGSSWASADPFLRKICVARNRGSRPMTGKHVGVGCWTRRIHAHCPDWLGTASHECKVKKKFGVALLGRLTKICILHSIKLNPKLSTPFPCGVNYVAKQTFRSLSVHDQTKFRGQRVHIFFFCGPPKCFFSCFILGRAPLKAGTASCIMASFVMYVSSLSWWRAGPTPPWDAPPETPACYVTCYCRGGRSAFTLSQRKLIWLCWRIVTSN